jgi:hypothetical protein
LTLARDPLGLNVVMWHLCAALRLRHDAEGPVHLPPTPRELSEEKLAASWC